MSADNDPRPPDVILAERQIREAEERGLFADLPGRGKPLDLQRLQGGPDALFAGLLKEAKVLPEWVDLASTIERGELERADRLAEARRRYAAGVEELRTRLEEAPAPPAAGWDRIARLWNRFCRGAAGNRGPERRSPAAVVRELNLDRERGFRAYLLAAYDQNRAIGRFNLIVPVNSRQRAALDIDALAAEFAAAWPELRIRSGESGSTLAAVPCEPPRPAPPAHSSSDRPPRDRLQLLRVRALRQGGRTPPIG